MHIALLAFLALLSTIAQTPGMPQNAAPVEQPTVAQVVVPAVAQQNMPCDPAHSAPAVNGPGASSSTDTPSSSTETPDAPLLTGDKLIETTKTLAQTLITKTIAQTLAQCRGTDVLRWLDFLERKPLYQDIVREKFQFLRDISELKDETGTQFFQPLLPFFLCHPKRGDALIRMLKCGMDPNTRADWFGMGDESFLLDALCATIIGDAKISDSFIVKNEPWILNTIQALLDHGADPRKPSTTMVVLPSRRPLLLFINTPFSDLAAATTTDNTPSSPAQKPPSIVDLFACALFGTTEIAAAATGEGVTSKNQETCQRIRNLMNENTRNFEQLNQENPELVSFFCEQSRVLTAVYHALLTKANELDAAERQQRENMSRGSLAMTTTTTTTTTQRSSQPA